jgi:predicted phage terminase large subunit-like protein
MEFLLTDIVHDKMEAPDSEELLWNRCVSAKRFWTVIIEATAYQKSVIQRLRRGMQVGGNRRKGLPVTEYRPTTDKVSRAQTIVVWFASGNFYFNPYLAGFVDFKKELLGFPRSGKDDQVDAVTIVNALMEFAEPQLTTYDEVVQMTMEEEAITEISKSNPELAAFLAEDDGVAYLPWWETV